MVAVQQKNGTDKYKKELDEDAIYDAITEKMLLSPSSTLKQYRDMIRDRYGVIATLNTVYRYLRDKGQYILLSIFLCFVCSLVFNVTAFIIYSFNLSFLILYLSNLYLTTIGHSGYPTVTRR